MSGPATAVRSKGGAPGETQAWIPCTIYFMKLAAAGSLYSFLPLYFYNEKGLTFVQIGMFGVTRPFMTFIGAPLWTTLADKHMLHRPIYIGTGIVAMIGKLCYLVVNSFHGLVLVCMVTDFIGSAGGPMIDHGVLSLMKDPSKWGRYRLWGAVGYGIAVGAMGVAIGATGSYTLLFIMHVICAVVAMVLVTNYLVLGPKPIIKQGDGSKDSAAERPPWSFGMVTTLLFGSAHRSVFFSVVLLCGIMTGVIENFLFIFLQDEVHASKSLIGFSRSVTCAAEVPMFWFSSHLIKRMGTLGVLSFACLCYLIRFIAYSLLVHPWAVLFIEPLHGITYAVMWSASASYAHQVAPDGMGASSQGILNGIHWGLGQGIGAVVGGAIFESYGARPMFRITSGLALLSLLLMGLTKWFERQKQLRSVLASGGAGTGGGGARDDENTERLLDADRGGGGDA